MNCYIKMPVEFNIHDVYNMLEEKDKEEFLLCHLVDVSREQLLNYVARYCNKADADAAFKRRANTEKMVSLEVKRAQAHTDFDWEKARDGEKVCTEDGKKASIVLFGEDERSPFILACITDCFGMKKFSKYDYAGHIFDDEQDGENLTMDMYGKGEKE